MFIPMMRGCTEMSIYIQYTVCITNHNNEYVSQTITYGLFLCTLTK